MWKLHLKPRGEITAHKGDRRDQLEYGFRSRNW